MSEDIKVTDGTVLEALNGKVDIDFDNVASNSVSFARMSREVTNCITEIPQRIKYTLENGTLTIKAGSVVIVPYGTEDLTAQYPKGATFLHENFKVYDTQFADGKFFVWVEVQNDIVRASSSSSTAYKRLLIVDITGNGTGGYTEFTSGSGNSTSTSNNYIHYNTTSNLMIAKAGGTVSTDIIALPIIEYNSDTTYNIASISQVFNGMGYIGSTIWVDKGVKCLAPNGRNEDGTLKNMELVTSSIVTSTSTSTQDYTIRLGWDSTLTKLGLAQRQTRYNLTVKNLEELNQLDVSVAYFVHVLDENHNYYTSNSEWLKSISVPIINATLTSGVVSNFRPKQPFRAVDCSQVDGQWVGSTLQISTSKAKGTYDLDLSDYLPKDGYVYEVKVATLVDRGSSGRAVMFLSSSIIPKFHFTASGNACTPNTGTADIAVGVDRKLTMIIETNGFDSVSLNAIAYRRLGHIQ